MDWRKLLPFMAAVVVIALLVWWAGAEGVAEVLKRSDVVMLLLAFLAYFGGFLTWALRWHVLIESLGLEVRFRDTLAALFIGVLFNNITPGARGGGEAARVYYLVKRSSSTYGQIFATVTADRVLDLLPVMAMLLFSAGYVYTKGVTSLFAVVLVLTLVLAALTGVATLIITSERRMKKTLYWLFGILLRLIPSRVKKYEEKFNRAVDVNIPHFTGALKIVIRDRRAFALSTLYSFITWFFVVLRNYLVFLSLGYHISFLDVMAVQMIATAVGLISVIPGGAGLIEATTSGAYVVLGVTREMAVTSSIVDRIISFWLPLVIGMILMSYLGLKPKTARTSS
ncbi:hypothetical protein A3L09_00020 [Thermococcus profundus]|uniref:TIGR00374 family protein n=1 Tax=Thermococcus profundus TaxID=49899 RepID=A0A2Z2MIG7_THEPR|nr:flippase-like domain-containing protein [Thermococcus profundus]ASJ01758.1 hypothetical protein A3L09_00020 [Thermococcus profundus]